MLQLPDSGIGGRRYDEPSAMAFPDAACARGSNLIMTIVRRFLTIFALMFWVGGFMFYGAVVVPIIREQLSGMPERSFITQRVTQWMNLFGTGTLLMCFIDIWGCSAKSRWRWLTWFAMLLPHIALIVLHRELSRQMADPSFERVDMSGFLSLHRVYLILSTLQWLASMAYSWLALKAWRTEDRMP